jgi:predicted nucleic acid-binding Zn ribbon protein
MAIVRDIPKCPTCGANVRHLYFGSFGAGRKENGWYCTNGHKVEPRHDGAAQR